MLGPYRVGSGAGQVSYDSTLERERKLNFTLENFNSNFKMN